MIIRSLKRAEVTHYLSVIAREREHVDVYYNYNNIITDSQRNRNSGGDDNSSAGDGYGGGGVASVGGGGGLQGTGRRGSSNQTQPTTNPISIPHRSGRSSARTSVSSQLSAASL